MPLSSLFLLLFILVGVPAGTFVFIALRLRAKERRRDGYLRDLSDRLVADGFEALGNGVLRDGSRCVKVQAWTNPLFSKEFSVRIAAYSRTVHECELRRGRPVEPEFAAFGPLLERWDSAGKIHLECYAAGVTSDPAVARDVRELIRVAEQPLSRTWSGGTFTYREGFEDKVPQWHWRHDQRPRLPPEARRWCVSYWHGDPYLNGGLIRLLDALSGAKRRFVITDADDLSFLEHAFGPNAVVRHGMLVEPSDSMKMLAADRQLDGQFFGGLLVADDVPNGWEDPKRYQFHDRAIDVLPRVELYARRLFDDEFAWYSGEYEIVSVRPLDVRSILNRLAKELGASVMEIDRRFRKRLVTPPRY